jgi:hypothetical protein
MAVAESVITEYALLPVSKNRVNDGGIDGVHRKNQPKVVDEVGFFEEMEHQLIDSQGQYQQAVECDGPGNLGGDDLFADGGFVFLPEMVTHQNVNEEDEEVGEAGKVEQPKIVDNG